MCEDLEQGALVAPNPASVRGRGEIPDTVWWLETSDPHFTKVML